MTTLLLGTAELAQIQADIEAATLPDTCNILSLTRTSNSKGGWTEAWGTALGTIACRIDPTSGREQTAGAALQPFYSYVCTLPHATAITEKSRVEISDVVYTVVAVDANKSWSGSVRAYLERATNG